MALTKIADKPIPGGIVYMEPKKKAIEFVQSARIHLYKKELWTEEEFLDAKESALYRVDFGRLYYSQEMFKAFWDNVSAEIYKLKIDDLFPE